MASNSCEQNVHRSNSAYRNCLSKWLWCPSLKFFRPALAAHAAGTRCTHCSTIIVTKSLQFSFYILLFIRVSLHVARLSLTYYYTHAYACVVIIMRCESAARYNIFALLTAFQRRVCLCGERGRHGEPSRTRAHSHLLSIFIRHSIPFCRAFLYCFEVDRDNSAIYSAIQPNQSRFAKA